jgi:TorA maturation chaperone TorD
MDINNWQTILAACQPAYGFLAKAFYEEPESTFVGFLFDENLFADWPLGSTARFSQTGLDLLGDFGKGWEESKLTDLTWDYRRLFVGPDRLKAYPWESVYLGKDHILFDEQTIAVRQLYWQAGLQVSRQRREPEDHIGLELAFMTHLCSQALGAIERSDHAALADHLNTQRDFLRDHLLCWTPAFAQAVIQHADTDYYRGVAYLLLGTLDTAARLFGLELEIKESTLDAEQTQPVG